MTGSPPRVFLSYARQDGEAFATALRYRLAKEQPEITLWQDRAELEGGASWWPQAQSALDQVKFLIIVVTPRALESAIVRREWHYARRHGVIVYPVKGAPDDELDYSALPRWIGGKHVFDIGRWTGRRWKDAREWETFVNYLKSDRQPVRVPFLAPDLASGFVPRPTEFDEIVEQVLDSARTQPVAITTALQGAGGYGKTTLAIALCHDERVSEAFDDGVLWTSVGESSRVVDELARWYEAVTGQRPAFTDARDAAIKLADKLEHRHCLLVIDDVWERHHLELFLQAGKHSTCVITTRRGDLVQDAARIRVDEMTADQCVRLLAPPAAAGAVPYTRLAALARQLGEWPLLMTLAAGMIRSRVARGDSADGALTYAERALQKRGVTAFDRQDARQRADAVDRTVAASLDQLSATDRNHFQELAIFPEEAVIPLTTLERLWGLDDLDAADCARRLDDVAVVLLDLRRGVVTLHDVMRAYLRRPGRDLGSVHARLVDGYGDPQHLPDPYAWQWLPYHLAESRRIEALRALLLTPEWLQVQLQAVGPYAVVRDFGWIQGDPDLEVIHGALRLALPALASDPSQFCEQLWSRLPTGVSDAIDRFRSRLAPLGPLPRFHARWPNLEGPAGALRQTLSHRGGVNGALVLPDGRLLSWSADWTLRVWDLATGEGYPLMGHHGSVSGALPLPDGRVLSWSSDQTLRVWDLATGGGHPLTGHHGPVSGALPLSDGQVLSWSADQTLRVWDLATGEGRRLTGHAGGVNGALLLPEGRALSWSDDGTLRIWDLAIGEGRPLTGHAERVSGARMLPDGRLLSWSHDGTLRVWDLAIGAGWPLTAHVGPVSGALPLSDRQVLSWSSDQTLRAWDLATGESRPLTGHDGPVSGALPLPDGRVLSWSGDRTLRIWDLADGGEGRLLTGHGGGVNGALPLPDGRVLSWSVDRTLRAWDLTTGRGRPLAGHEYEVTGALSLLDGRVLSWSGDGTLRIWDLTTDEAHPLTGHEVWVSGARWLPDGRVLSWSWDWTLRVWNLATGEGRSLTGHEGAVNGALSLPDGRLLSWSTDQTLRVWDLGTGKGRPLTGHEGWVTGALPLSDGRVLSWSYDRTLRVWDLATGEGRPLTGHEHWVTGALPLPDGRVLSWSNDRTVRLWDLLTGEGRLLTGHGGVSGALLLPDERVVLWGSEGTLRVWDFATGESRPLTGHEGLVNGALLLRDGRVLSWSNDRTLWVWDLATGEGRPLRGHEGGVTGALLLPDGRVLSWGGDLTPRMWDLAAGEGRPLTGHEGRVSGALPLPDGRVLSWGWDRTLRLHTLEPTGAALAFWFDGAPAAVLATGPRQIWVGDTLGRVHFLELLDPL